MANLFLAGEDPVQELALFQIDHVEPDVFPQADEGQAVVAGDGVRKDHVLAHVRDLADDAVVPDVEHGQHGPGSQEDVPSVQAHDAVVGVGSHGDPLDEFPVLRIDHHEAGVFLRVPESGGSVDLLAVHGDGGTVAASRREGVLPQDLLRLQVESAQAMVGRGVVDGVVDQAPGEASKSFLEDGDVDPPDEIVAVVDVEDEDAGARSGLHLSSVRSAHVKVAPGFGLAWERRSEGQEYRERGSQA